LLCEYAKLEQTEGKRVVEQNDHFLAVVPFWAVWPFETMVIARRHLASLDQLTSDERDALADILKRTTARYDRLFDVSFPYSMVFTNAPPTAPRTTSGTSTCTSTRPCCGPLPFANFWSAMKCWRPAARYHTGGRRGKFAIGLGARLFA